MKRDHGKSGGRLERSLSVCSAVAAGTDKTLVSWVCLANTTQQGGSALTIQRGDQFDGIVFGERAAGKWMAGSDFFDRTQATSRPTPSRRPTPRR